MGMADEIFILKIAGDQPRFFYTAPS